MDDDVPLASAIGLSDTDHMAYIIGYYEAVQEATNEHDYEWIEEDVEDWTELLTIRDWAALEEEWAEAYSA